MKLGNLYNLKSFDAFIKSGEKAGFKDAAAGVVLARNLTAVDPQIFEKKYPELSFVNSGIEVDNFGGYTRNIQSLRVIEQGDFSNAEDPADDKGKISLTAEDSTLRVMVREGFSQWTDDEVKEAELQNLNLVSRYLETHNRLYHRNIDLVGYIGIPDFASSTGLLNYSGFTSAGAGGAIGTLTSQQQYDAISDLIISQWNAVNNTPGYKANRVVMPVSVMNVLQSSILNTANGALSVLQALRMNYPEVEFLSTFRAEDVGGSSVTCAYSNSMDVMKMRVPVPLTIGEIVRQNSFHFRVDSKYRIAGLDVLEDAGGYLLTGL